MKIPKTYTAIIVDRKTCINLQCGEFMFCRKSKIRRTYGVEITFDDPYAAGGNGSCDSIKLTIPELKQVLKFAETLKLKEKQYDSKCNTH